MMNKKGFSLIELLAVITILAIIMGVAAIAYTAYINKARDKVFETYMDDMHEASVMYFISNTLVNNGSRRLSLSDLNIATINNPKNETDKCLNSYVDAKREDKNGVIFFTYKVCLICDDYSNCKDYTN